MKIFAHRGYSHKFPEATKQAYQEAISAGSHGFECDVRLTKDRQVVCFHDRTLKRITGDKKAVARLTLEQLMAITEVITLEELLELSIKSKQDLLIETKHPVLSGPAIESQVLKLLAKKAAEISEAGIDVVVMSFSYFAVRRIKSRYSKAMKVIKYAPAFYFRPTKDLAVDIELLRKHPGLLNKALPARIFVWTVNSKEDLKWLKKRKIYGVITDRPKRAGRILLSSHSE